VTLAFFSLVMRIMDNIKSQKMVSPSSEDLVHMGTSDPFKEIENYIYELKKSRKKSWCSQLFIPQTCKKLYSNTLYLGYTKMKNV
jgi:hypothetical protein